MNTSTSAPPRPAPGRAYAEPDTLLLEYARTHDLALRNELVVRYEWAARYVAGRFTASGGNTVEDLVQVGYVGLIGALERYRPECGVPFASFALPTILGEVKRHLRDASWLVKVPRRLKEMGARARRVSIQIEQQTGRAPTAHELAEATGIDEERLLLALEVQTAYRPSSLGAPPAARSGDGVHERWDFLGAMDPDLAAFEERHWLSSALLTLSERDRAILRRRFFGEESQAQVARAMGLSQMHVSRLERRALRLLKERLSAR